MGMFTRLAVHMGFVRDDPVEPIEATSRDGMFSTHNDEGRLMSHSEQLNDNRRRWQNLQTRLIANMPRAQSGGNFAMDGTDSQGEGTLKAAYQIDQPTMSEALMLWYAAQTFIGYQMCAIIAQHWLVDKACSMPARDAIRKGYKVVSEGVELPPAALALIKAYDKAYRITWNMEEYLRKGRIFGVRVAFFKVNSPDPLYYEKPFNIDGVMPNSYRGIVQVDPYWAAPMLDDESSSDPSSMHFYEPTYWIISGKKYHRSHLVVFVNSDLPDILKPTYMFGGVPLPQQIMERIYAAERTANEGPLLAMTKRTTVFKTNAAKALANLKDFMVKLADWCNLRDNFQVKVIDKDEDEIELHETSLSDLDSVIMTQYQLVCSIAGVPATKMLGTQPKGFNATGEYDESNYHEGLETLQTHGASPLLERHHQLVVKSFVAPKFGNMVISHEWNPLDAMTAKELAETNLLKAQTDVQLVTAAAIDGVDVRNRLIGDSESGYTDIPEATRPNPDQLMTGGGGEGDDTNNGDQNAEEENNAQEA